MKIYTRAGDTGTTGLLFGGRVPKTAPEIQANGDVDEAQAALGVARAAARSVDGVDTDLDRLLVEVERDLYVLMAEVATAVDNRQKLVAGRSLVTEEMVGALEAHIDRLSAEFPPLRDFTIPGHDPVSAALDVARTVVRRAERSIQGLGLDASHAPAYLNRLSDLVWTMARWREHGEVLRARDLAAPPSTGAR
ncbi:MAG TPA: cob(I)yrinic acid a,c-diamide adenosyltransferase [Acidimicrobiales bacterium]|nr:cob(I)yrinic acid a,c-diamide adenosyltransferase [Acidimicrobiales bacterium]